MKEQYPLIKAMGLNVELKDVGFTTIEVVKARDIEKLLADGVRVYGQAGNGYHVNTDHIVSDTHSGLLIGYSEIPKAKPVSKAEVLDLVSKLGREINHTTTSWKEEVNSFIKRISENGLSND